MKNKFALYVHWPFCGARCTYCDFTAFPYQEKRIAGYAETLREEIRQTARQIPNAAAGSVYFGGGTPSHVPIDELAATVRVLEDHFAIEEGVERTVEANPEDVNPAWATEVKRMGFQRVSLGLQTFDDALLAQIERTHTANRAEEAVDALRRAGIGNLSLDLMIGLPNQTMESVHRDLQKLFALDPPHLSVYSLTVASGTRMHRVWREQPESFPSEDEERAMMRAVEEQAASRGYRRYEIANFAKPGFESRHNLSYWRLEDYLGFGLDAAGYWNGAHYHNPASLRTYTERIRAGRTFLDTPEPLTPSQLASELLLTGLRLAEGIRPEEILRRSGYDLRTEKADAIETLCKNALLQDRGDVLIATQRGRDLLDTVLRELMP